MTSPKDTTPPTGARLPTPTERPTWVELVNQERHLLDGLVQLMRARSRRMTNRQQGLRPWRRGQLRRRDRMIRESL